MKTLLSSLFIVLFISCSSSTGPTSFEPHQNGTWYVKTTEQADWLGLEQPPAKITSISSDTTIYIGKPDDHAMRIIKSEGNNTLVTFNDSTMWKAKFDSLFPNSFTSYMNIEYANNTETKLFETTSITLGLSEDYSSLYFPLKKIKCNASSWNKPTIIYLGYESEERSRHYELPINGLGKTAKELVCS